MTGDLPVMVKPGVSAAPGGWLLRLVLLAGLWAVLTGGEARSWVIGAPLVLVATQLSWRLAVPRAHRWSVGGTLGFLGYFLVQSWRGGLDVAWRALSAGPRLSPGVVEFATRLPDGAARVFLCGVINLLPGTAVVEVLDHRLLVHVLDASPGVDAELRRLEQRVGAMFGVELDGARGGRR